MGPKREILFESGMDGNGMDARQHWANSDGRRVSVGCLYQLHRNEWEMHSVCVFRSFTGESSVSCNRTCCSVDASDSHLQCRFSSQCSCSVLLLLLLLLMMVFPFHRNEDSIIRELSCTECISLFGLFFILSCVLFCLVWNDSKESARQTQLVLELTVALG